MYKKIGKCRICGNTNLVSVVDLGMQKMTGIFPKTYEKIEEAPLELVRCKGGCGLVQLQHSCSGDMMYGERYGYRSGLNISMINHLNEIILEIQKIVEIKEKDLIIDIGSNDGTLLRSYGIEGIDYIGVDPTGEKFKKYYPDYIEVIADFFSADIIMKKKEKRAKVITSIAMFYDLEDPIGFAKDIEKLLEDEGIWVLEQSYLPLMLLTNSYDTICQEHLEYYCLRQIEWIMDAAGLKVINVSQNDINGGSFRVIVAKKNSKFQENVSVQEMRDFESVGNFDSELVYDNFKKNIINSKKEILDFFNMCRLENKKVFGYGASTKGNVLLQYCGIDSNDIVAIAEVNEDKYGCVTPGTNIPIISEKMAKEQKPDYFFVLPWHFKKNILEKEMDYIKRNEVSFVFPLPSLEIVKGV